MKIMTYKTSREQPQQQQWIIQSESGLDNGRRTYACDWLESKHYVGRRYPVRRRRCGADHIDDTSNRMQTNKFTWFL